MTASAPQRLCAWFWNLRCWRRNRISIVVVSFALGGLLIARSPSRTATKPQSTTLEVVPLCDADGCREDPTQPSTRTAASVHSIEQLNLWHQTVEYQSQQSFSSSKPSIAFLGDSITEAWLGTAYNQSCDRCNGIPQVREEKFKDYETIIYAISGDQTQHVLHYIDLHPKILAQAGTVVVLIGTNNLGNGMLPTSTALGIQAVVTNLVKLAVQQILLIPVLPRYDNFRTAAICPPRCKADGTPHESFLPAIKTINRQLEQLYATDPQVHYLNHCGIDETVLSDKLHPNTVGHQKLADCILRCIEQGECYKQA